MPHCPWMYNAISITDNTILPCCRFQKDIIISNNLMEEYKNGELADFRTRLESGEKLKECYECWLDEECGRESMRQQGLSRWGDSTKVNLRYAEFQLDNTCNLRCITCNSYYSSSWTKDERIMFNETFFETNKNKKNLYEHIDLDNLETVKLFGGEPLLSKNIANLCKKLSVLKNLNKMEVVINTNATRIPSEYVEKVFLNCGALNINLSIDALGDLNHFIRYPAPWKKLLQNLKYFENLLDIRTSGTTNIAIHTVAYIYNINYIAEIQNFFKDNFPKFSLRIDPLIKPKYLSIINLPNDYKSVIKQYLNTNNYQFLIQYLDRDEENLFDYFIENHKKLIELRKVDFSILNPLLYNYIKNYPQVQINQKKLIYFKKGGA